MPIFLVLPSFAPPKSPVSVLSDQTDTDVILDVPNEEITEMPSTEIHPTPIDNTSSQDLGGGICAVSALTFSLDTMCTSQDILTGLEEAGVITASIYAVQRKSSTKSWVLTFHSMDCNWEVHGVWMPRPSVGRGV